MVKIAEEPKKKIVSNDIRIVAHSLLVEAAAEIGQRCIKLSLNENPDQLIRLTEMSEHAKHHQKYPIDLIVEGITNEEIRPRVELLEGQVGLSVARRMEHSPERVVDPKMQHYILSNPIEGSDNFANAVRHRAQQRMTNRNPRIFNPQAGITLALVDGNDPLHPIATAVYHFYNDEIYSSITIVGPDGKITPMAFLGKEKSLVGGLTSEQETSIYGRDLTFLVADYKFNFRKGIEAFQTSLVRYGLEKQVQNVDPTGGECCTASNILQVIDGEGSDGYIDLRALFTDPPKEGRYAKMLYTNAIAVLPIAEGFGF
ncbi:MAG: hypothetical protein U9O94_08065, partial [Nanoarchaeota archaeon]|nr:hypothetical protein [Nanoarchaeota archaeon]